MKNNSHSPVTEMLSGKNKIWLMIGLALMSIADLSACVVLWIFGAAIVYWFIPFIMAAVDLLYLLGVALSNQRFKYAQLLFIVYMVLTATFVVIWICTSQSPTIFANTVVAAWSILHAVGIVAAVIAYLYAARVMRGGRTVQFALAIAFSAVALLGCVTYYGITIFCDGYFGQGNDTFPLIYEYIGDDECAVTGIVWGNGDRVVIPYEFNGRKVTKVSANVFSYADIKSVTLNCDSGVELCNDMRSGHGVNSDIQIYVDKKDVDTVKLKLYGANIGDYYPSRHELGNNVHPINLDKDEVYVTFDYDRDAYMHSEMAIIPTWYGKKGETFRLSDIEGLDYVDRSDVNSDDDLFYCYNNVGYQGGGYMMSELKADGAAIDGAAIDASCDKVRVRFQRVTMVYPGEGNDTMYDTAEHFEYSTVDGTVRDYKLTVAEKADELLAQFDRGEGFVRTMRCYQNNPRDYKQFTSLADVLSEPHSTITIAPYWDLAQPQITISTATGDTDVIYGDDFELAASVTHPLDGIKIEYEWYGENTRIGVSETLRQRAMYIGDNRYGAIAKISAPQITSCSSANAAEININVLRRPITVKWTDSEDNVYDGTVKRITAELFNALDDDNITLSNSQFGQTNAATNTYTARLSGGNSYKYYIAEGETHTFTVLPCPVPLTWDDKTEFPYDGNSHSPTAHAYGLRGGELEIRYIGRQTDAGENYTAIAEIADSNYTIDEASSNSIKFKITPMQVEVTWGNTSLTYNGRTQAPTATARGVDGKNIPLTVSGVEKNVGGGVAIATTSDKNYTLTNTEKPFTIAKKQVTITVDSITVEYGQKPDYTSRNNGIESSDDVKILYTADAAPDDDGNIAVGTYAIGATVTGADASNYDVRVVRGMLTVTEPKPTTPDQSGTEQE